METAVYSRHSLEKDVLAAMKKPRRAYWIALIICALVALNGWRLWYHQIVTGMGVAGKNNPVSWAIYISDFVFWVGIAHSGTLISAVLFLFRAKFRSRFNRAAEAMTIIALMVAGLYPILHLGRCWLFYWLIPYPNQRQLWVNFKSPLVWDVFAVSTYFIVSAIFFYIGMIPDIAIAKSHAIGIRKKIYSLLALGWHGSLTQWKHYNQLYLFLAGFATPLVISVHSVVSWDFAMSIVPGWHTTMFAPYFVAGAIFSGTAMVITLVAPMRKILNLENYIRAEHFDNIAKILLFTSLIVTYFYMVEYSIVFYGGNIFELEMFKYRATGFYRWLFWGMLVCNSIIPLTLFIKKLRRNIPYLFVISILVNIGMWLERFVIIITSLAREYDPYSWGNFVPSLLSVGIILGTFGMFFMLFLLFIKVLPVLSITEIKEVEEAAE